LLASACASLAPAPATNLAWCDAATARASDGVWCANC
jgi:hypothetical protein